MTHTLLLNANYQVLAFISERRAIKLLLADKVDVLSFWEGRNIFFPGGNLKHPATMRMKYLVKLNPLRLNYSKSLILRRDRYRCSYCEETFSPNKMTVDHVIPKSQGGKNSFYNCVAACHACNLKKADKPLENSGLTLKINPLPPEKFIAHSPPAGVWHDEWAFYLI